MYRQKLPIPRSNKQRCYKPSIKPVRFIINRGQRGFPRIYALKPIDIRPDRVYKSLITIWEVYLMDMTIPFLGAVSVSQFVIAIVAIVFGIIMCVVPRIAAYLIGAYLIFWGVLFFVHC